MEAATRNHAGISEPEIEEITVYEETISQTGDGFEEVQQGPLDCGWRRPQMGIGQDHECLP
jgi:hypothetical protein